MNTNEKMNAIAANPAAAAMADRMLANHDRELSFGEVVALVYSRYFENGKDDKNES